MVEYAVHRSWRNIGTTRELIAPAGISVNTAEIDAEPWFGFLCATSVVSVTLWWLFPAKINHRDTEDTEVAQRRSSITAQLKSITLR